tara:strand:+ start:148 stop:432 length:285 start_codon:yes stop_codon:yes gene_type:complete
MIFHVGEFKRSEDADYDFLEGQMMNEQLGSGLIDDMLKYSTRAWKEYGNSKDYTPSYYLHVHVYCEFDNAKRATWFQLKYPNIKSVSADFAEAK